MGGSKGNRNISTDCNSIFFFLTIILDASWHKSSEYCDILGTKLARPYPTADRNGVFRLFHLPHYLTGRLATSVQGCYLDLHERQGFAAHYASVGVMEGGGDRREKASRKGQEVKMTYLALSLLTTYVRRSDKRPGASLNVS